jgi:hypothetical protein
VLKKFIEACGDARLAFFVQLRGFPDPSIKIPVRSKKFPAP